MDNLFTKKVPLYFETDESQLVVGDSFKILTKMEPESVDMIFADPPYFLSNDGITCKGGGGSKLNETARSYKMLSQEADTIDGFTFVWFTDGIGWKSARGNLRETFEIMDTIYSIDDMENGVIKRIML